MSIYKHHRSKIEIDVSLNLLYPLVANVQNFDIIRQRGKVLVLEDDKDIEEVDIGVVIIILFYIACVQFLKEN